MVINNIVRKNLVGFSTMLTIAIFSNGLYGQQTQTEDAQQTIIEVDNSSEKNETVSSESVEQTKTTDDIKLAGSIENEFDVDQLIKRMKKTKAIGFITKLSLKNQVDDLLSDVEVVKNGNGHSSDDNTRLRSNFDGLILKTVTLLNKGEDYTLAEYIYEAREQLWKSIMENKV